MARTPMVGSVNALIFANRRVTIDDILEHLGISLGTPHKIVHDKPTFQRSVASRFHQDNASAHTAARTAETINPFDKVQLPHLLYNSDQTPSDIHLFGPLIEFLDGISFQVLVEVNITVSK